MLTEHAAELATTKRNKAALSETSANHISDSKIAMRIFVRVSKACPSSNTGQAAMIARICQEQQLDPFELGQALLKDTNSVSNLVDIANNIHSSHGLRFRTISNADVRGVVSHDFNFASRFMSIPQSLLIEIEEANHLFTGAQNNSEPDYKDFTDKLCESYRRSQHEQIPLTRSFTKLG